MEKKTRILSVSCQKGGVGKSLISLNISYTLAKMGYKVLLMDMDPQATSSYLLNVNINDDSIKGIQNILDAAINTINNGTPLSKETIEECILRPTFSLPVKQKKKYETVEKEFGFDLIPSNIELANYDILLNNVTANGNNVGGYVLTNVTKFIKNNFDYDFIIEDVLPGLNMIAYNCLASATDGNLLPVNMDKSAITGGQNLLTCITEIQHFLWEKTTPIKHNGILGVIKNEYRPRLKVAQELDSNLFTYFGPAHIFESTIPTKASCDSAHIKGRLYAEYDKQVGEIFEQLAHEVINELDKRDNETEPTFIEKFGQDYIEELNDNENQ